MSETATRRPRRLLTRAGWFAAMVLGSGVLGGLVWRSLVTLPAYSVGDSGAAQITEQALGQVFASDGVYVVIGMLVGLLVGVMAWRLFHRLGWPVAVIAVAGGLAAAGVCWLVGILQGPQNFADRISAAQPGELVPIDFELRTVSAVFVWALGAIIPIMLYANLSRDTEVVPRRRRAAVPRPAEAGAD